MQENEFLINKFLLSVKIFTLLNFSALLGLYNEIVYSVGLTFTAGYAIYNFYLLYKNKKKNKK